MARVLLVDDDPLLRTTLAQVLAGWGYHVVEAADGRQALGQLRRQSVDVVVTDILMPEVDGLEVIRAVLRDHPGVAVIGISGGSARQPGADALQLARTLGAHAILPKPFSGQDLHEVISGVLRR